MNVVTLSIWRVLATGRCRVILIGILLEALSMVAPLALWFDKLTTSGEIYVMDADGSNKTNLTNNPGHDFGANWSPGLVVP